MIHPHTELRFVGEAIGFGVFATKLIPKGTLTWVHDPLDQTFAPGAVERLGPLYAQQLEKYAYADKKGDKILCWDLARYFNHSCDAPCLSAGYDFEVAVRDIRAGEELTDDYGTLNLTEPMPCACASPRCRRTVRPDDHVRLADAWDALVRDAFPLIAKVEQPLWPLVKEAAEVTAAIRDPALLLSCRVHFGG